MSRWAAHFLVLGTEVHRMYCLELDKEGNLEQSFPLTEEISGTSFVEGILLVVPVLSAYTQEDIHRQLLTECFPDYPSLAAYLAKRAFPTPAIGEKVRLFQVRLHPFSTSELCTDHSSSNRHI